MKPLRSRMGRLVPILVILVGGLVARSRGPAIATSAIPQPQARPESNTPALRPPAASANTDSGSTLDLQAVSDPMHREQIARVVESMDRNGTPPEGVAQGGRRGAKKGIFQNAERRLPRKALGYWVESDVWPKNGPRDAERLIFGREHEVYWTRDHYETFVRLR
ncbi:MAG: ribonuclease domain-containing protein [Vicinamibacteria bacterium]